MQILIYVVILISVTQCNDTLQQLHVLVRHGARTPSKNNMYPTDPYYNDTWYPDGLGALTKLGKVQEYNIGKKLRATYNNFLEEIYTADILDGRSTDSSRTKMSIELVLASLFPPNPEQQWNKNLLWQPIPYNYEKPERDKLLGFPISYCPEYEQEYQNIISRKEVKEYLKQNAELIHYINENSGLTISTTLELFELCLGLIAEETAGKILPEWTKAVYPKFLKEAASYEYELQLSSNLLVKVTGGPLIKKIIADARAKINGSLIPKERKIFLYSAHEYNIAYILGALKVFNFIVPPYGSYIIFELHKVGDEFGFKIFYEDYTETEPKLMKIKGCGGFCPLEQFINATKDIIPEHDWC